MCPSRPLEERRERSLTRGPLARGYLRVKWHTRRAPYEHWNLAALSLNIILLCAFSSSSLFRSFCSALISSSNRFRLFTSSICNSGSGSDHEDIPAAARAHLRLEEVLRSVHSDLLDVDLRQLRQLVQATLLRQLSGLRLPVDQKELPEADLAVSVLVDLLDHRLQSEVSLRRSDLLHHLLQFLQVQVPVSPGVVPENR